ncbi:MAG: lysophospholipid transporter LplT [Polaromonas sp.]|nr:lysophospholipid transporter LplT [Polaromonas sp.]
MPTGFYLIIAAQFVSALADNALLIVSIALLSEQGLPAWWAPMLKFVFTISYVVLAPFVGPLADAVPKARLMAWMNGVKILGVAALLLGFNPLVAFAIAGLGATAYAPAKYGLITEIVAPHLLVKANGWLETSVVCAALLGAVLGGVLVNANVIATLNGLMRVESLEGISPLYTSLLVLLMIYGGASLLNLGIPHSGARYPASSIHPLVLIRDFWRANLLLWRDAEGGLSLAVTTIFWGLGATLQFIVLKWSADVLFLPLEQSAYLQTAVAVGVVVGAVIAGRWIPLRHAKHVLPAGVLMGLLITAIAHVQVVSTALLFLALIGVVGGILVVPLNALLQHRGFVLLSAGRSVAVQGFNENLSVLCLLGVYAALVAADVSIVLLLTLFGLCTAAAIGLLLQRGFRAGPTR